MKDLLQMIVLSLGQILRESSRDSIPLISTQIHELMIKRTNTAAPLIATVARQAEATLEVELLPNQESVDAP
jgi:hypothetical protein